MSASEIVLLTAVDLAAKIRNGELRCEEVMAAHLAHIAEREPEIGAWTHLDPAYAMEQARNADRVRGSGRPVGALHGVPFGAKDIYDSADMPTENGSVLFAGRRTTEDASILRQFREAGAILTGKTVTTEFAVYHPGKTRNPRNVEHTPGGSSSGSAAAVAANMVPLALGTQTNGSVLRPASFCGVYGYKPSFGLTSRTGILTQSPPLDTPGIFARSLEDIALAADFMTAYDPADKNMRPRSRGGHYDVALEKPPLPPLFAFVKSPVWDRASTDTQEAFGELAETLGATCEEVELPPVFGSAIEWHSQIMLADLAKNFGGLAEKAGDKMSDRLRSMIDDGRRVLAVDYNRACDNREILYEMLKRVFERYSAIITPVTLGPAPRGLEATGDPIFCTLWTYLGVPALSLPLLEIDDMPVGVQLVGLRNDDARLMRTARWLISKLNGS